MTAELPRQRDDVKLRLSVTDDDRVEMWSRDRMPMTDLVSLLRQMADKFEAGDVTRVE